MVLSVKDEAIKRASYAATTVLLAAGGDLKKLDTEDREYLKEALATLYEAGASPCVEINAKRIEEHTAQIILNHIKAMRQSVENELNMKKVREIQNDKHFIYPLEFSIGILDAYKEIENLVAIQYLPPKKEKDARPRNIRLSNHSYTNKPEGER